MAKVGKRYFTDAFKREAAALWETSGRMQTDVAREPGNRPLLCGWPGLEAGINQARFRRPLKKSIAKRSDIRSGRSLAGIQPVRHGGQDRNVLRGA